MADALSLLLSTLLRRHVYFIIIVHVSNVNCCAQNTIRTIAFNQEAVINFQASGAWLSRERHEIVFGTAACIGTTELMISTRILRNGVQQILRRQAESLVVSDACQKLSHLSHSSVYDRVVAIITHYLSQFNYAASMLFLIGPAA